ncbi:MAG: hypothetical protein ACJZ72_09380 [Opitutales bacterium]
MPLSFSWTGRWAPVSLTATSLPYIVARRGRFPSCLSRHNWSVRSLNTISYSAAQTEQKPIEWLKQCQR